MMTQRGGAPVRRRWLGWAVALAALAGGPGAVSGAEEAVWPAGAVWPERGLKSLENLEASPVDGILRSWELQLPEHRGGCYFADDGAVLPGNANRVLPWAFQGSVETVFQAGVVLNPAVKAPNRKGVMGLWQLRNGEVLALLPVAGAETVSWLEVAPGGKLWLRLGTLGVAAVKADAPVLAWGRGKDALEATRMAWEEALAHPAIVGRTNWREKKEYPEPFRYLGWCSWEQYKKEIDADLLIQSVRELEASGLPVRWVLVDDGHQQGTVVNGPGKGKLRSLSPDPVRFPQGWAPLLATRKPDKIRWFGLWHAFLGLWENVDAENDLGELNRFLMPLANGTLVPRDDAAGAAALYDALIESVRAAGFDFAKVDVQTNGLGQYRSTRNAAAASALNSQALETAVQRDLSGLINCMAHNTPCVFNTRFSAVTRCSIDYHLGQATQAKSHLWQSYATSVWLAHSVWPDHDMFHSSDPECGRMMAISKALSGAPIYLSDAPRDLVAEFIRPLCYREGELLRPLAPAAPLPDSLFQNPLRDWQAYRVIAPLAHGAAAIALYNLGVEGSPGKVHGRVEAADYTQAGGLMQPASGPWTVPAEGLVVYDWHRGQGGKLAATGWQAELPGFADRLVFLTPIREGWSVIGRADLYLSPAAVVEWSTTPSQLRVKLKEAGPVVVYSEQPPAGVEAPIRPLGHGLWRIELPAGSREHTFTLHR